MTTFYWTYLLTIISTALTGISLLTWQYLQNKAKEETAVLQPIPVEKKHNH